MAGLRSAPADRIISRFACIVERCPFWPTTSAATATALPLELSLSPDEASGRHVGHDNQIRPTHNRVVLTCRQNWTVMDWGDR